MTSLIINLSTGSALVALCVMIHTGGLMALAGATPRLGKLFRLHGHNAGRSVLMMISVMGIFAIHTVEVWAWALAFWPVGATEGFLEALDLSTAMFSTIGYGGIDPNPEWRLLTALEGIAGFILIGWSTAYLVGASTRHGPFRKEDHF